MTKFEKNKVYVVFDTYDKRSKAVGIKDQSDPKKNIRPLRILK